MRPWILCSQVSITTGGQLTLAIVRTVLAQVYGIRQAHPRIIVAYNQGYLSDAQVNSAVTTLNQYFSGQGFQFRLIGGQRVQNSNWFYYSDLGPDGATDK